jgi:hypothetical protein
MSDRDKPFECVGERRESAAAIRILSSLPGWRDTPVVHALSARARDLVTDADVSALLAPAVGLDGADAEVASRVRRLMTEGS